MSTRPSSLKYFELADGWQYEIYLQENLTSVGEAELKRRGLKILVSVRFHPGPPRNYLTERQPSPVGVFVSGTYSPRVRSISGLGANRFFDTSHLDHLRRVGQTTAYRSDCSRLADLSSNSDCSCHSPAICEHKRRAVVVASSLCSN